MSRSYLFISFILCFLLNSCCECPYVLYGEFDRLNTFIKLSKEICDSEFNVCNGNAIVISDFINIDTWKVDSKGILFSEYMKAALSKVCSCEIYEVKLRRSLKLSEEGLVALTRNAYEVKNRNIQARWIILGTYRETEYGVTIFVKLVDFMTGKVKKVVVGRFSYSEM